MAGLTLNISGLNKIYEAFDDLSKKTKDAVKDEVNASALNIQSGAKRLAPVNFGTLRNSIYLKEIDSKGGFVFTVGTKESYAAYVEFGTGGKVSIPKGFESEAAMFKGGKRGTFADFIKALTLWVERKGIGERKKAKSTAYAIAISILRKGLRPQPYLIPSFEAEKPKLIQRLKNIVNA